MEPYKIKKLDFEEYNKCSNIWDMDKQPKMAETFYEELVSGNRVTFICIKENTFIGEGSLVFKNTDPHYTIPNKRIYLSRMIVKEEYHNRGIGGMLLQYLTDYALQLGYEEVTLGVDTDNMHARHLYEKNGFTEVLFIGADQYGEYVKLLKKLK
ncbi:GNAT family N-acetyltransferase [Sporosarcina gallistercoris]|uniref:GNAT family N-acetyltransferase n=1 Tax=Sporosarcina gallistercoris TaxID=2762245 RepID=UPI003D294753